MDIQPISVIYNAKENKALYEYQRQLYSIAGDIANLAPPQILDLNYSTASIPQLIIPGNIQYNYAEIILDLYVQIEITDDNSVSWPLVAKDFAFGSIVPNDYIKINGIPNPIMLTKSCTSFHFVGPIQNISIEKLQFAFMSDISNYVNNSVSSLAPITSANNTMGIAAFVKPTIKCFW